MLRPDFAVGLSNSPLAKRHLNSAAVMRSNNMDIRLLKKWRRLQRLIDFTPVKCFNLFKYRLNFKSLTQDSKQKTQIRRYPSKP